MLRNWASPMLPWPSARSLSRIVSSASMVAVPIGAAPIRPGDRSVVSMVAGLWKPGSAAQQSGQESRSAARQACRIVDWVAKALSSIGTPRQGEKEIYLTPRHATPRGCGYLPRCATFRLAACRTVLQLAEGGKNDGPRVGIGLGAEAVQHRLPPRPPGRAAVEGE